MYYVLSLLKAKHSVPCSYVQLYRMLMQGSSRFGVGSCKLDSMGRRALIDRSIPVYGKAGSFRDSVYDVYVVQLFKKLARMLRLGLRPEG